jgi:hypothetical protein
MKLSNQTVIVLMSLIAIFILTSIGVFIYQITRNELKNPKNDNL